MKFGNHLEYFLFRALVAGLQGLGADRSARLLGQLGPLVARLPGCRRQVVLDQLAMVYPEWAPQDRERLAGAVYRHLGSTVGEVFGGRPAGPLPPVEVEPGWAQLDAAVARGRGVIVATGHIGNFELGGAVLAARYTLLDVVKPQRNRFFDDFLKDLRARRGILTVPMDGSGPALVRHLRRGGVVSLLLDQDAGAEGIQVDFLGHPAATWPGAARLSLATGCPVAPMALVRRPDRSHRLLMGPLLQPHGQADAPADVAAYLQRISLSVEELIREHPEQWFWVHRRWKSAPQRGSQPRRVETEP